jgi:hypothetical protein
VPGPGALPGTPTNLKRDTWRVTSDRICSGRRCSSSCHLSPVTRHPIRPASIKVMQRTFNPQNRARYPGGPPFIAGSSNRRTALPHCGTRMLVHCNSRKRTTQFGEPNLQGLGSPFQPRQRGKLPPPNTPGGEIASCLAYTQKSRGQNLPGRPLPRCITSSAPVSDTGCLGANPSGAANLSWGQIISIHASGSFDPTRVASS